LELTELILVIGNFSSTTGIVKFGGVVGVITAVVAWYASSAGVMNGTTKRTVLPVGTPLLAPVTQL
jgi:succinate-acetate transporter protein